MSQARRSYEHAVVLIEDASGVVTLAPMEIRTILFKVRPVDGNLREEEAPIGDSLWIDLKVDSLILVVLAVASTCFVAALSRKPNRGASATMGRGMVNMGVITGVVTDRAEFQEGTELTRLNIKGTFEGAGKIESDAELRGNLRCAAQTYMSGHQSTTLLNI